MHSGEHEKKRTGEILDDWKKGHVFNPSDVAYLLLGTVPTHFGPNGAQGGWYASRAHQSNRGGQKGMDSKEIQAKDAHTLQHVFKMDVPSKALAGELDPGDWDGYVGGGSDARNPDLLLQGEDHDDPKAMVNMILGHTMPQIKVRNTEALIDLFMGYKEFNKASRELYHIEDDDERNREYAKLTPEAYARPDLAPLIKDLIVKLAKVEVPNQSEIGYDPYWYCKEKLLGLARKKNWSEVFSLYEHSDQAVREAVFRFYEEVKDVTSMFRMLDRETSPENLNDYLPYLLRLPASHDETVAWIEANRDRIEKIIASDRTGYYRRELTNLLGNYMDRGISQEVRVVTNMLNQSDDLGQIYTLLRALMDHKRGRDALMWITKNKAKLDSFAAKSPQDPHVGHIRSLMSILGFNYGIDDS